MSFFDIFDHHNPGKDKETSIFDNSQQVRLDQEALMNEFHILSRAATERGMSLYNVPDKAPDMAPDKAQMEKMLFSRGDNSGDAYKHIDVPPIKGYDKPDSPESAPKADAYSAPKADVHAAPKH